MKVLVTGAGGFLGRHTVASLLAGDHEVRALVRPGAQVPEAGWSEVEIVQADLRDTTALAAALDDVDALVHLAAAMRGSETARFSETVLGTEQLFRAVDTSSVRRVVLCSSFATYDWLRARGVVDEGLPASADVYGRGGYAAAKLWQERLAQRHASEERWELTVLRPGFVWGLEAPLPESMLGPRTGAIQWVLAPSRELPLTHVVNCASAFRAALESPSSAGAAFNVVDGDAPSAWAFAADHRRHSGERFLRIPVPSLLLRAMVVSIRGLARWILGPNAKLPFFFTAARFAQAYRPLRYSNQRLREQLGWKPPLDVRERWRSTWAT